MASNKSSNSSSGTAVGQSEEYIWSSLEQIAGLDKTQCLAAAYFISYFQLNQNPSDYANLENEIKRSETDPLFKDVLDDIALLCARYKNMKIKVRKTHRAHRENVA
jgi:hypothetical protein